LRLDSVLSDGQVNAVHSYANHGVALTLRSSAILVKPCGPNVLLTWMIGKLRRQISLHWEIVHQMSPSCLIKNSYSSGANLATLSNHASGYQGCHPHLVLRKAASTNGLHKVSTLVVSPIIRNILIPSAAVLVLVLQSLEPGAP
jgi:hypothetical protein